MEAVADSAPVKENEETGVEVLTEKVESETPVCESMTDVAIKEKAEKTSFELSENVNSTEDTEDESDNEEMETFLRLMSKAEKKNEKTVTPGPMQTIHLGASSRASWRGSNMGGVDDSDSDTSDEDDTEETRRFLSLMGGREKKASSGMVNIRWEDGRVVGLPPNIKVSWNLPMSRNLNQPTNVIQVTRVPQSEESRRRQEEDLIRRRREHLEAIRLIAIFLSTNGSTCRREGPVATTCSGKRKFEERMTLSEAKADDFTDTKDYVDFIQAKLKNVNIKIIK